ncbi:MAG: DegT/DnrJ/EryC1/StrS family aminotransferase [Planctomycetes bacterium]|nr:DegT/DnrJ/EryC1/StrS family aminotransferase [Planctomycetota bacterium]
MPVPVLNLKAQYASIKSEIDAAVADVFTNQSFILGPIVEGFEKEAAAYLGVKHAIGVNSGSDALLLALMAANVGPGDEVLVPAFTFFATAGAVARLGAKPVFCDVHADTFNIDVADAQKRVTKKTKAIIPVDLYGQCADLEAVMDLAAKHKLTVIEDAAQAFGATRHGKKAGQVSHLTTYSFYPTKNIGGAGDGGMIATNDDALADSVKLLHTHGERPRYFNKVVGICGRLDALQAAVLRVKLKHLDKWNARRGEIARIYDKRFAGAKHLKTPVTSKGNTHIYHQYTLQVGDGKDAKPRDDMMAKLSQKGVGSTIYYPVALHRQECFAGVGQKEGSCPVSEKLTRTVFSLPMYPELTDAQANEVADAVLG